MTTIRREGGFALPLTIFVLTLITIMLAAIFVQVQVDRRIAESSGDLINALSVAQSGLERYIGHHDTMPTRPADGDSLRLNVTGGYADVVAHVVRRPADSTAGITYVVRSTGRLIKPTQGSDPQAVRTVAQFAQWQYGTMRVLAALTAINDLSKPCGPPNCDGTFRLNGLDQCVPAQTPVFGLRVPNGPTPASALLPPQSLPFGLESDNASAVATATSIDWAAVVAGGWHPDYTSLVNLLTWSTYYFSGDVTLTDVIGNGLLVVEGDLTLSGALFNWQGVVLVGGQFAFEADTTYIRGAAISGLGVQTAPPNPAGGEWGLAGTDVDIAYHSCNVRNAFRAFTGFSPIRGAWMDNWATY